MNNQATTENISGRVKNDLSDLTLNLRTWIESHLVTPYEIDVYLEPEGLTQRVVWLVTDDTGCNDSSYRIVYDKTLSQFGLIIKTESGIDWLLGCYGSLKEAVESM